MSQLTQPAQKDVTVSPALATRTPLVVLQVIPSLESGGAERATIEIARAVVAEGGRALVATSGGRLVAALGAVGGEVIRMRAKSKNPLVILWNAERLARIAREEGVQVIHARSRAPAWSGLIAAGLADVPFVTTFHGLYKGTSALKRWYNGVMARGATVIANSEFTAAHIRRVYPWAAGRIVTIPRGVDVDIFAPEAVEPARAEALRRAWGVLPGVPLVLLPGRLTGWKGQDILLEGLARLDVPVPPVGVFVGDTQSVRFEEQLKAKAEKLGLTDRVRFAGYCADMPAAYRAADVVVSASTEPEAFGRVAVEAQALGAVVVATDLGATAETVLEGEAGTGFRIPAEDPEALALALAKALALSPAERGALARRAIAHVRSRYTLNSMAAATLNVYRSERGVKKRGGRHGA